MNLHTGIFKLGKPGPWGWTLNEAQISVVWYLTLQLNSPSSYLSSYKANPSFFCVRLFIILTSFFFIFQRNMSLLTLPPLKYIYLNFGRPMFSLLLGRLHFFIAVFFRSANFVKFILNVFFFKENQTIKFSYLIKQITKY